MNNLLVSTFFSLVTFSCIGIPKATLTFGFDHTSRILPTTEGTYQLFLFL